MHHPHRQDNTYHGLCYTSRGALAGTRNSSMGPMTHHTMSERSYHGATSRSLFFQINQDFLYNVVMAGCVCTVGEMNAMLTFVFLNEIVLGVGVLSWYGQPLPMVIVHH